MREVVSTLRAMIFPKQHNEETNNDLILENILNVNMFNINISEDGENLRSQNDSSNNILSQVTEPSVDIFELVASNINYMIIDK